MTATRAVITSVEVLDVRFPTTEHLDGSDGAMRLWAAAHTAICER
jgi:hypothetical protein